MRGDIRREGGHRVKNCGGNDGGEGEVGGHDQGSRERGEAAIAIAVAVVGNAKLTQDRYEALHTTIVGDRERGEGRVLAAEAGTLRGSGTDLLPRFVNEE